MPLLRRLIVLRDKQSIQFAPGYDDLRSLCQE